MRPRCGWVCDRLGEYYTWDLKPAEFQAIEKHLYACPTCADEWRKTERLLSELEAISPIAEELNGILSDRFIAGAMARIAEYEAKKSAKVHDRWHWLYGNARRFAAVCVMLISTLALAYVGLEGLGQVTGSDNQKQADGQDKTTTVFAKSEADQPTLNLAIARMPAEANLDLGLNPFTLDSVVSHQIDEMRAKAQVEALLPHTEAEWEA